ncbi:MAG TPA: DUF6690 family protein [Pirellulales bacterium]|nr:DUF6690 family protein [Pirellulales bacterium]
MFSRSWFAMMLVGSVALPYLYSATFGSSKSSKPGAAPNEAATSVGAASDLPPLAGGAELLAQAPTKNDLAEVFRWDVTTAWILGHWPRVSAGLSDVEMQGYRVPLVTGAATDDLAGSLTYYFNKRQRVERITFYGTTGDSRRLVALLAGKFSFVRELNDDPSLFLYRVREGRKVVSELRIKPAHIVRSDEPFSRFEIALLIQRPRDME